MDFFSNFNFINQFAKQLIQPRLCHYRNQDIWKLILNKPNYSYENIQFQLLKQNASRKINLSLIKHNSLQFQLYSYRKTQQKQMEIRSCIVYSHGLSSFSIQGSYLIEYLDQIQNCSLCLYDSRGHGKDQAPTITFGMQQSEELLQILFKLQARGINNFILWGRSMGATTILKMLQDNCQKIKQKNIRISTLIIDSPFSSFQKVALQMISAQINLPQLFGKIVLGYLLKGIKEQFHFDIKIDVQSCQNINIPTLVLYSQHDKVISPSHAKQIYSKLLGDKKLIDIKIGHNQVRSKQVVMKAVQMIKKSLVLKLKTEAKRTRSRSISITKSKNVSISIKGRKSGLSITKNDRSRTQKNEEGIQSEVLSKKLKIFGSQIIYPSQIQVNKSNKLINAHKSQVKIKPSGLQINFQHNKKQSQIKTEQRNTRNQPDQQPMSFNIQIPSSRLSSISSKRQTNSELINQFTDSYSQKTIYDKKKVFQKDDQTKYKYKYKYKQQGQKWIKQSKLKIFKQKKFRQTEKYSSVNNFISYKQKQKQKQNQPKLKPYFDVDVDIGMNNNRTAQQKRKKQNFRFNQFQKQNLNLNLNFNFNSLNRQNLTQQQQQKLKKRLCYQQSRRVNMNRANTHNNAQTQAQVQHQPQHLNNGNIRLKGKKIKVVTKLNSNLFKSSVSNLNNQKRHDHHEVQDFLKNAKTTVVDTCYNGKSRGDVSSVMVIIQKTLNKQQNNPTKRTLALNNHRYL